MPEKKMTLAIDFDGVIHTYTPGNWEGIEIMRGKPMPECKRVMNHLAQQYKIVIHTCRAVCPEGINAVRRYMKKHKLPYDEITAKKPAAVAYIDDRGFKFENWSDVLVEFKGWSSS